MFLPDCSSYASTADCDQQIPAWNLTLYNAISLKNLQIVANGGNFKTLVEARIDSLYNYMQVFFAAVRLDLGQWTNNNVSILYGVGRVECSLNTNNLREQDLHECHRSQIHLDRPFRHSQQLRSPSPLAGQASSLHQLHHSAIGRHSQSACRRSHPICLPYAKGEGCRNFVRVRRGSYDVDVHYCMGTFDYSDGDNGEEISGR